MNTFKDYHVKGAYEYMNENGTFFGDFRIHSDGLLVGTMDDAGTDIKLNEGKAKVVIGKCNESNMYFWKFSHIDVPLVYVLKRTSENEFEGKWVPLQVSMQSIIDGVNGHEGIAEIQAAFNSQSFTEAIETLGKVEKRRIEAYLDPNMIMDIQNLSDFKGRLSLEEIMSFQV